jgi:pyocin large subunit-like protein
VTTQTEYEAEAVRFLTSPSRSGLMECNRTGGDVVKYDTATEEFGVLASDGTIRTYYKPVPCSAAVTVNCHGETDNLAYFRKACQS